MAVSSSLSFPVSVRTFILVHLSNRSFLTLGPFYTILSPLGSLLDPKYGFSGLF
jgi:hypothetical protein